MPRWQPNIFEIWRLGHWIGLEHLQQELQIPLSDNELQAQSPNPFNLDTNSIDGGLLFHWSVGYLLISSRLANTANLLYRQIEASYFHRGVEYAKPD